MDGPRVTVVVVPRERFGVARRALDAVSADIAEPFRLVYVAAGAPPRLRRHLQAQAAARGFTLLDAPAVLTPNQARNLALPHVDTRYVAFIDNDVVPERGWLGTLVRCAEETGAWVVGPIYYGGAPGGGIIHMAGGDARIESTAGRRRFVQRHRFVDEHVDEVRHALRREPCGHMEFHCMVVRRDVFDRLGPLDEGLWSLSEHIDLCWLVQRAGGEVYFEPAAGVTYVTTAWRSAYDLRYFEHRWSDGQARATIEHFCAKWGLDPGDPSVVPLWRFSPGHRHLPFEPLERALIRVLGWRRGRWVGDRLIDLAYRLNRWWVPFPTDGVTASPTPPARALLAL